jgi:SAM-dependent methyltransferase
MSQTSEPYDPDNLLDRLSSEAALDHHYRLLERREQSILRRRLPLAGGRVLSVGAGWHPGRHLFPAPAFEIVAVDSDPGKVAGLTESGRADEVLHGSAGALALPDASFDIVLYRLVLHHVVFQGPLSPVFAEAARLLVPGGAMVAIEPGLWHPVGAGLALANRAGLGELTHGTPDDVPLSPRMLGAEARAAGLIPELHSVTYTWRRLPVALQRAIGSVDQVGSRPRAAALGHTLMLIARQGGQALR